MVVYPFKIRDQGPHEVFAVIFDDSVYLYGVVESNEAPELSFDFRRILFRAIIISTMSYYLSKNSHTHQMKIDQTRIHAMHFSSDAILNLLNQNLSPSGSFTKCDSQFIESLFISIRIICPNAILLVRRVFPNVIACLSSNVAMSNVEALCCVRVER